MTTCSLSVSRRAKWPISYRNFQRAIDLCSCYTHILMKFRRLIIFDHVVNISWRIIIIIILIIIVIIIILIIIIIIIIIIYNYI